MALLTTSSDLTAQTVAAFIQRLYAPDLESIVFRNKLFLGLFGRMPSQGDRSYRWPIHTGGNASAERYVENQALPVDGQQAYTHASLDYENYRGIVKITGDVRAALKSDQSRIFNAIEEEMTRVRDDILDVITIRSLGAAGPGFDLAVDGGGTYAGVDRAVTPAWASQEDPVGGALTKVALDQLYRELLDADRAVRPTISITTPLLLQRYIGLVGGATGAASLQIKVEPGQAAQIDIGAEWEQSRYNTMPVFGIPDVTAGVWFMGDRARAEWIDHEDWKVTDLARVDDADRFQISKRGVLVDKNPQKWGKLTGAT